MKVWMTIGYGDCELNTSDNVFQDKDDAINFIVETAFNAWCMKDYDVSTHQYVNNPYIKMREHKIDHDEFVEKTSAYIRSNTDVTRWYIWVGSAFWNKIFPFWNDTDLYCDAWFGLEEVEMR